MDKLLRGDPSTALSAAERAALERLAAVALDARPYMARTRGVVGGRVWYVLSPTISRLLRRGLVRVDFDAPVHCGMHHTLQRGHLFPLLLTRAGFDALPPRLRVDWALRSGA